MMEQLIQLIIVILVFSIAGYGAYWVCEHFKLPLPVYWIVGAALLICLLMFIANNIPVIKKW